jgi:hypothetical protein
MKEFCNDERRLGGAREAASFNAAHGKSNGSSVHELRRSGETPSNGHAALPEISSGQDARLTENGVNGSGKSAFGPKRPEGPAGFKWSEAQPSGSAAGEPGAAVVHLHSERGVRRR